jgi:hypothetical protein
LNKEVPLRIKVFSILISSTFPLQHFTALAHPLGGDIETLGSLMLWGFTPPLGGESRHLRISASGGRLLLLGDHAIHFFFRNLQSPSKSTDMSMIQHERCEKSLIFLLFLLLFNTCTQAQSYYTTSAPEAPGLYRKTHLEISLAATEKSVVIKLMDAIVDEVNAAYP